MFEIIKNGGPAMWPLLICSIISLTIIFERFFFWISAKKNFSIEGTTYILELAADKKWEEIRQRAKKKSKNYIIRILIAGIVHKEYSMQKAMESAAFDEIKKMKKYMGVLDTIITAAPLLGILGTVTGIIFSFDILGSMGIQDPSKVTSGIAQALITTAAGLSIAIFTLFPYNYFNSKIENSIIDIEKYTTSLEVVFNSNKKNEAYKI